MFIFRNLVEAAPTQESSLKPSHTKHKSTVLEKTKHTVTLMFAM